MTPAPERSVRSILLTREWALAAGLVVLAMIACALLGWWQFTRYEGRSERKALIETNYSAPAVPLTDVLATPSTDLPAQDGYRTVRLTGEYCTDPGCVLYVRNRPLNGTVGFFQLVPFRTDEGTVLVVRGWVQTQEAASVPDDPPAPPSGPETIVVRMHPDEPMLADRRNPPGQIQSIAPEVVAGLVPGLDRLHTGAYGELVSESSPSTGQLLPLEKPDTGLGPHLSYAFQWWAFGVFFPVAWVVRARRAVLDARALDADDAAAGPPDPTAQDSLDTAAGQGSDAKPAGAASPAPSRRSAITRRRPPTSATGTRRRRGRDENEEDELLDAPPPPTRVP